VFPRQAPFAERNHPRGANAYHAKQLAAALIHDRTKVFKKETCALLLLLSRGSQSRPRLARAVVSGWRPGIRCRAATQSSVVQVQVQAACVAEGGARGARAVELCWFTSRAGACCEE
jgi:hypothetical protein